MSFLISLQTPGPQRSPACAVSSPAARRQAGCLVCAPACSNRSHRCERGPCSATPAWPRGTEPKARKDTQGIGAALADLVSKGTQGSAEGLLVLLVIVALVVLVFHIISRQCEVVEISALGEMGQEGGAEGCTVGPSG